MCGIIGYVGKEAAAPILLSGLERLEYRGYDSAGIALLTDQGELAIRKGAGKLNVLVSSLGGELPAGSIGVGHTRWATHGKPTEANAHPHLDCKGEVVVIHNGIVENYVTLKKELIAGGHNFTSQTDTEVLPHLIEWYMAEGDELEMAVRKAIARIEGAHAIIVMSKRDPNRMVAARIGNAGGIVVGYGEGEMYVASDLPAILPYTRTTVFLSSMEMATITSRGASYYTTDGEALEKTPQTVPYDPVAAAKGGYKHFMLKEIIEQPEAVMNTIRGRIDFEAAEVYLEGFPFSVDEIRAIKRVILLGMGSSLHAAMVGRFMMEELARLPAEVDNASEFRYRDPVIDPSTLVVSICQSGETVDTLAAMDEAKTKGCQQVTICNIVGSQATRLAEGVVYIRAGLEIGVCATKTLTTSMTALLLLAAYLGQVRGALGKERMRALTDEIARLPHLIGQLLEADPYYEQLAHHFFRVSDFLYLGRGIQHPIALEGALKLKEISYIHGEGYPAGEMKHGPIALIDENMPVVAIALRDKLYDKMVSNIEQVKARGGVVIALATEGDKELASKVDHIISIPAASPLLMPILTVVPLQLLAYHIAVRRGLDVDQPRNLAKTVTVE